VLERHLLVVTRAFADQEILLDRSDLAALAACLAQIDGLGFYNGGAAAGASQAHKHLQLVPLPLAASASAAEGRALPIETWLEAGAPGRIGRLAAPPFAHAFAALDPAWFAEPESAGARLHELYTRMLAAVGIEGIPEPSGLRQSAPYNLLATRRFLLLVPRTREECEGISVNALGFAGSLFVHDEAERARLRKGGPLAVLRGVAFARQ
jgi:ATP adenylyltransferase